MSHVHVLLGCSLWRASHVAWVGAHGAWAGSWCWWGADRCPRHGTAQHTRASPLLATRITLSSHASLTVSAALSLSLSFCLCLRLPPHPTHSVAHVSPACSLSGWSSALLERGCAPTGLPRSRRTRHGHQQLQRWSAAWCLHSARTLPLTRDRGAHMPALTASPSPPPSLSPSLSVFSLSVFSLSVFSLSVFSLSVSVSSCLIDVRAPSGHTRIRFVLDPTPGATAGLCCCLALRWELR